MGLSGNICDIMWNKGHPYINQGDIPIFPMIIAMNWGIPQFHAHMASATGFGGENALPHRIKRRKSGSSPQPHDQNLRGPVVAVESAFKQPVTSVNLHIISKYSKSVSISTFLGNSSIVRDCRFHTVGSLWQCHMYSDPSLASRYHASQQGAGRCSCV